jgi:cyanate permease
MKEADAAVLSPYRWVIVAVSMFAGFIGSYAQFQLPPLAYKIIPSLNISSSDFALLMGGPLTGSLFICLIGGNLADRFGVKNVVTVGLVLAVIGCTFRYAVTSFWPFFFLAVLAGLASGLLITNLSKLFGAWFPPEQMGMLMGLYMVSPMLAGFAGTATTPLFPSEKSAFIWSGVACFVILILWLIFAKNKPEGAPDVPAMPVIKYLDKAARSRAIWLAGLCALFIMGSMMTYTGFLPKELLQQRGVSEKLSSLYGSLPNLGGLFGCFLGPLICRKLGVMKPYIILVSLAGAVVTFLSWQMAIGPATPIIFMLAGCLQSAVMPLILSLPMLLPEIGPVYAGSAGGIISTLQVLGGIAVPSFVITRLAGPNSTILFGLAALCCALVVIPAMFLPELGAKALAARMAAEAKAVGAKA